MRNNKGYTLIELVVATLVAMVLILSMVTIIAPIYKTYQRTLSRADAQLIAENLLDSIRANASTATSLTAEQDGTKDTLSIGSAVYAVSDDGYLMLGNVAVFPKSYYAGKHLSMTCKQEAANQVAVTLSVSDSQMQLTEVTAVISSMRAVLGTSYSLSTPEGALQALKDAIRNYTGSGALTNEALFREIYDGLYDGAFPEYSPWSAVSKDRIQELYDIEMAAATKNWAAINYYRALLNNTFYLAVYATGGTGEASMQPIVYLTDSGENRFDTSVHGTSYMVYWNGQWYAPKDKSGLYRMPTFNNKTSEQITQEIAANWILATSL